MTKAEIKMFVFNFNLEGTGYSTLPDVDWRIVQQGCCSHPKRMLSYATLHPCYTVISASDSKIILLCDKQEQVLLGTEEQSHVFGSQCREFKTGVICTRLQVRVTNRIVEFCTL